MRKFKVGLAIDTRMLLVDRLDKLAKSKDEGFTKRVERRHC